MFSLKNLIVLQTKSYLKAKDVLALPEDIQTIVRCNVQDPQEQKHLFLGDVVQYCDRDSVRIAHIGQYQPYYTLGDGVYFHPNGRIHYHGYWYKGKRCWEHRTWFPISGRLKSLITYNKHGVLNGPYMSEDFNKKSKGHFVDGRCERMIERYKNNGDYCIYSCYMTSDNTLTYCGTYAKYGKNGFLVCLREIFCNYKRLCDRCKTRKTPIRLKWKK